MQKFKLWRTVDCVVGGIYYLSGTKVVEYLLLGLYDDAGLLHYVGRCGIGKANGQEVADLLAPLIGGSGFTGRAPGGVSRWTGRGACGSQCLWSQSWWWRRKLTTLRMAGFGTDPDYCAGGTTSHQRRASWVRCCRTEGTGPAI